MSLPRSFALSILSTILGWELSGDLPSGSPQDREFLFTAMSSLHDRYVKEHLAATLKNQVLGVAGLLLQLSAKDGQQQQQQQQTGLTRKWLLEVRRLHPTVVLVVLTQYPARVSCPPYPCPWRICSESQGADKHRSKRTVLVGVVTVVVVKM